MLNQNNLYCYIVNDGFHHYGRFNSHHELIDHVELNQNDIQSLDFKIMPKTCIFLDDERIIDDVYWVKYPNYSTVHVIRTYDDFKNTIIDLLWYPLSMYDFSFDHDIQCFDHAGNEKTGYDCVKWLCDYLVDNGYDLLNLSYTVHSQNPIGKENIESYISNYTRFQQRLKDADEPFFKPTTITG